MARAAKMILPKSVANRLRPLYNKRIAMSTGIEEVIAFPPDVASRDQVFQLLKDTDIFGPAPEEGVGYLRDFIERFRITMAVLPELSDGARVLELGANPYFLTRLLRRRQVHVTCANGFGERSGIGSVGSQTITYSDGTDEVFHFDHFNSETETFPYDDGTFDVVLCCEILEHLPNDPVHVLAEVHRVLKKPRGTLVLTTPNAVRLSNVARITRGDNVYEALSGYGVYGRHNREYTVAEVRMLLTECGFAITRLFATDVHPPDFVAGDIPRGVSAQDRGDNIFAIVTAVGDPRWPYPEWLYQSRQALRRIVRADMAVGYNDDLQSDGFHERESWNGRSVRWTGHAEAASAVLNPGFSGPGRLVIEGIAAPATVGESVQLSAHVGDQKAQWVVPNDGKPFTLVAPVHPPGQVVEVQLRTDRTWLPASVGIGRDQRRLGVAISRVAMEPADGGDG